MKKIKEIANCGQYVIGRNNLYIVSINDYLQEIDLDSFNIKRYTAFYHFNLLECYNDVLYFSTDQNIQSLDNNAFVFKTIWNKHFYNPYLYLSEKLILERKYDRITKKGKVVIFEAESGKELWKRNYDYPLFNIIDRKIAYLRNYIFNDIEIVDVNSGNSLWSFHSEFEISKDVLFYINTIILSIEIKPLEEYRLLGLDARTGEEKWRIEDADYRYIQDPMTGYLYDIGGKRFNVVDPGEGKILYKGDMTAENKKFDILPEWGILGKNSIYFIDNFPRSRVGRIDLKTYKIEFVVDLNFSNGVKITDLSYHNGRLYILDTDKTLHIFAEE